MKDLIRAISSVAKGACLATCLLLLTGCAMTFTPMFQQLEAEKATRVTLVVERAPFEYTPPVNPESMITGGGVAAALLGNVYVQYKIGQIHPALNERAKARGISNDHRQVFIATLVQKFAELGVTATVVPLPYECRAMNGDRVFYRPVPEEVAKLPKEPPAFYLNLDMGSCTVDKITPCIRYILNSTNVITAPGPGQKYGGIWVLEPDLWSEGPAKSALRFASQEDAVARIEDFDAEIARLVPLAASRLVVEGKKRIAAK